MSKRSFCWGRSGRQRVQNEHELRGGRDCGFGKVYFLA